MKQEITQLTRQSKKYQTATGRIVYLDTIRNVVGTPVYKNDILHIKHLFPATQLQLEAMEASGNMRAVQ